MDLLLPLARDLGTRLRERGETIAVSESSAAGLISAALLAQAGASAYFLGGAVPYTAQAREALLGVSASDMTRLGLRSSSEPYAAVVARAIRDRHGATWGLAETGAAGPTGNRYGDPAGLTCIAISGPVVHVMTLRTESSDRQANMRAFAMRALEVMRDAVR